MNIKYKRIKLVAQSKAQVSPTHNFAPWSTSSRVWVFKCFLAPRVLPQSSTCVAVRWHSGFQPLSVWGPGWCPPAWANLCLLSSTSSPRSDKGLHSGAHTPRIAKTRCVLWAFLVLEPVFYFWTLIYL